MRASAARKKLRKRERDGVRRERRNALSVRVHCGRSLEGSTFLLGADRIREEALLRARRNDKRLAGPGRAGVHHGRHATANLNTVALVADECRAAVCDPATVLNTKADLALPARAFLAWGLAAHCKTCVSCIGCASR